ncbi:hypothetical protein LJ737_04260 [Hymenobacter sp. 15J16-1T3B]|uniref:hypothetical protein n=1 Tax=Hymenobacter sp. 15J16-1T3B TaxID=2886941 RepID=UPI001D1209DD|nr:hypothetical protein [Hymenobacter sp. 15J16-1T3B]MCC3156436.1 hypothetical protein [Hymenobacter sp. 15J16-1T3B]
MTDIHTPPPFKELDRGTLFMGQHIWHHEETNILESSVGVWEWEQVAAVCTAVEPPQFPEWDGPLCCVLWAGRYLYLCAEFQVVLLAWRRYKQRYGGQYVRLLAN